MRRAGVLGLTIDDGVGVLDDAFTQKASGLVLTKPAIHPPAYDCYARPVSR